jgi:hypothetical protein
MKQTNPLLQQQLHILEQHLLPTWTGDLNKHQVLERSTSYRVKLVKGGDPIEVAIDMINCFGPFLFSDF